MPGLDETTIIAAQLIRDVVGQIATVDASNSTYVAVYPVAGSSTWRAEGLIVRTDSDIRFRVLPGDSTVQVQATTVAGAKLAAATEYVFALHPVARTLHMIPVFSTLATVDLRWIVLR